MKNENSQINTLSWIYKHSKKYIPAIVLLTVISIIVSVSFVALALVSKDVLDIATGDNAGNLKTSALWLFAIIVFQIALSAVSSALKVHISSKLTIHFRKNLFSSLMRKKYANLSGRHSGDILNRFTSDTDVVVSAVVGIIPSTASLIAKIISGVGTLLVLNSNFALIVLAIGVVFPAVGRLVNKRYKYLHKECQRTEGETRSFLQECFENSIVIKSFVSEAPFLKKLSSYMKEHYTLKMKRNNVSIITHLGLYSIFTIGYYAVLLWGAGSISRGFMTYGTLMAFLQLISQLRTPLQNVSGILPQYYSAIASAERIIELEVGGDDKAPAELKKDFTFIKGENLNFSYLDEHALKNCSFIAKRNEITAFTGKSGCGKSTLFKLLLGLFEATSGTLTLDGDTPIDSSSRGLFAFVPQGNLILSGSIRDNLTLFDDSISEEELIKATKNAEIYDYISSLPDGFDTILAERGAGLSEGQIQRLAIARALIYGAPILLLDEATSALDEATEAKVLGNIKALPDKTVLFITHRKKTLEVCDRIVKATSSGYETIKE